MTDTMRVIPGRQDEYARLSAKEQALCGQWDAARDRADWATTNALAEQIHAVQAERQALLEATPAGEQTDPSQWGVTTVGPGDLDKPAEELHARAVAETRAQLSPVDLEFADKESGGHTYWPGVREAGAPSFYHPGEAADCPTCNPIPTVNYEPGSKLEQLHTEYWAAKSESAAAEKRYKTATERIKTALSEATNGAPKVYLEGSAGRALYMDYRESERLNAKKLREDVDPAILEPYLSVSGAWYLTERKS